MPLDFTLTPEQEDIKALAHEFAEKEIRPVAAHYDETEEFPWPVLKKAHEVGLTPASRGPARAPVWPLPRFSPWATRRRSRSGSASSAAPRARWWGRWALPNRAPVATPWRSRPRRRKATVAIISTAPSSSLPTAASPTCT